MTTRRLLRLRPWIVRAMVPDQLIGSYVLFQNGTEYYVGRSDTCLRRRLLAHCATARGEYFTYDVHPTPELAFAMECSLFHTYRHGVVNVLHPDRPDYQSPKCPFCWDTLASTLKSRLRTPHFPYPSKTLQKDQ